MLKNKGTLLGKSCYRGALSILFFYRLSVTVAQYLLGARFARNSPFQVDIKSHTAAAAAADKSHE